MSVSSAVSADKKATPSRKHHSDNVMLVSGYVNEPDVLAAQYVVAPNKEEAVKLVSEIKPGFVAVSAVTLTEFNSILAGLNEVANGTAPGVFLHKAFA